MRRRPAGDGCREEVYKFLLLGDAHGVPSLRMHRVGRLLRPHGQQTATKPRPAAITLHHGPRAPPGAAVSNTNRAQMDDFKTIHRRKSCE